MTILAKNEADIIRDNIEFHLNHGVDFIIATDNNSTDGTREIFQEYEKKGLLFLIDEFGENKNQKEWVNRMGELAVNKFKADFVIHNDADEFWVPSSRNLKKDFLAYEGVDVFIVDRTNVIIENRGGMESFPVDTKYAVVRPLETKNAREESKKRNMYFFKLSPKVAFKVGKLGNIKVIQGNHAIENKIRDIVQKKIYNIKIYHFPIRSKKHFIKKVIKNGTAVKKNETLSERASWHIKNWYEKYTNGEIESECKKLIIDKQKASELIKSGMIMKINFNGKKIMNKSVKLITDYCALSTDSYSDGNVEDEMLAIFKSHSFDKKVKSILKDNPSWPMRYHLSKVRENLLSWYEFPRESSLLEIGAGCGAMTGLFLEKLSKVVAIELSKRRAEIIKNRYIDKDNLTIYAGNLNDIEISEKFDYVTLIGVLEYAGKFTHTKNPFVDFLKNIKKYLNKNGTLIIAIENKFGLKYWAGAKEDHTSRFFNSIENYPKKKYVQTFGKEEMKDILKEAGFESFNFYYPMPDYKLPTEIFSDEYLPNKNHNLRGGMFPVKDFSKKREILFNEKLAMDNIVKNKKFDFFANSFLIFVK